MRKILWTLLFCLPALGDGIKISELPLLGGASVDSVDSFPALDASMNRTVRIRVGDLFLVPSLAAQLAPFAGKMANPMTTLGDLIYGGASGLPTRLAAGTLGYVLTSNGPGVAPSYQAAAGGGITALTGEVTASGSGSVPATVPNAVVLGKVLTGLSPAAGTIAATDTILSAWNKSVGNMALLSPIASPTFTGTVTAPNLVLSALSPSTVPYLDGSRQLASSAVTPTELGYVSGATSAIQTQLNGKQASGSYLTALTGEVTASGPGSGSATVTNSAVIGKVLTGFAAGAGTVAATDTVLQAFDKIVGNLALNAPINSPTFTGTVTGGTLLALPSGSSGSPALTLGSAETFPARAWYESTSVRLGLGSGQLRFLNNGNSQIDAPSGALVLGASGNIDLNPGAGGTVDVQGSTWYAAGILLSGGLAAGADNTGCLGCDFAGAETGYRFNKAILGTKVVTPDLYVTASHTPASAGATCTAGQITWDADFTYVCVATNTWKRSALSTW